MDTPSALKTLGLTEGAGHSVIQTAQESKLATLKDKQASAPTDALKNKFESMTQNVNEAAEFLLSQSFTESQSTRTEPSMSDDNTDTNSSASSTSSRSALSQTKLADLPGMAMADSQQVELQPGTILLGRYEVKELVGQGGMGAVYRVYDQIRSEDIAIKVLLPSLTKNERALERFLNEAKISSKLSHPNIVNVYDVQKDTAGQDDLYFLTMELLEGQDLRQIMDNQTTVGRPFEIDDIKEYVQGITDGLNHAHKFTVHRDIKPENIWITEEGEVKLMDFGIAQLQSTSQRTQTGAAMGTAYYMAPEQLKGKSDIDGRADQYAVAVLMYELLTGEVPAGMIEPVNEARPDTPRPMVDAIHQALKPKPENRFESMDEFNEQIQSSKGGRGSKSGKKSTDSNSGDGSSEGISNKSITSLLIVFALTALGVGGLAYKNNFDEQAQIKQVKEEQRIIAKRIDANAKNLIGKLVTIPAGSFNMGSNNGASDEKPVHRVRLKAFRMMAAEVTFIQWDACLRAGGCSYRPSDKGWGRGNRPVINVSYNDITQQFIPWLNKATGAKGNNKYRLPSEAQWEYAARAGSTTKYSWGNSIGSGRANCDGCGSQWDKSKTAPVKSFRANQWGLYDMHGNVWEWTQDCWNNSYNGAPANGTAWKNSNCAKRVFRGGSWCYDPNDLRSAFRFGYSASDRVSGYGGGFRLVQGR
jgi:formylglycine-generating enzyme required for sulfatase activity